MTHIPDELYKDILDSMPIACVDIVIVREGQALLVRRNDAPAKGQWWIPGGRVLKGETLKDAARRKALEETGLVCEVGPAIYTDETIFQDGPHGCSVHSINTVFYMTPTGLTEQQVSLDSHHSEHKWVDLCPWSATPYVRHALLAAGIGAEEIEVPDIDEVLNVDA